MQLNFSFKKAYDDLIYKQSLVSFILVCLLMFLNLVPILGIFTALAGFGFYAVIAHNIIQNNNPVVPRLTSSIIKKLLPAGVKMSVLALFYNILILLTLPVIKVFIQETTNVLFTLFQLTIITLGLVFIIFLAYLMLVSFYTIFAEKLTFCHGFNLLKLLKTHKYVWKEYFLSTIILILSMGAVFGLGWALVVLGGRNSIIYYISLAFFVIPLNLMLLYFYVHLIAQAYKYALLYINRNFENCLEQAIEGE